MQIADHEWKEMNDAMKAAFTKMTDENSELKTRMLDVEQKQIRNPRGGDFGGGGGGAGELARLIADSENVKSFLAGGTPSTAFKVPSHLLETKATIISSTALVSPDRRPEISAAPGRRLLVRDLFPRVPVASGPVEITRELLFTNSAAPQGSVSPIGNGEGEPKAESSLTFELLSIPVSTIAHWIPASRQVLADAPMLQAFVEGRLLYGLALKVETSMISGNGGGGELDGLIANSTAFTGGSTNASTLDTLSRAIGQLVAAGFEPSAIVVHPTDWFGSGITLAKDSQQRYQFGAPGEMTAPSLWGIRAVITASQPAGTFLALDAARAGFVAVREDALVRISENTDDDFIRNKIRILVEERLALCITQPGGIIYGSLTYAG